MAAQRSSPVRNSAPYVKSGAEITLAGSLVSDAARFSRSRSARSSRTNLRSPVTSLVPAQKSERTSPREGSPADLGAGDARRRLHALAAAGISERSTGGNAERPVSTATKKASRPACLLMGFDDLLPDRRGCRVGRYETHQPGPVPG